MLANVIFPAFYLPYVAMIMNPIAAVAGLAAEYIVFVAFNPRDRRTRLVFIVVLANVASSCAGIAIARVLPSGLAAEFVRGGTGPARGPEWNGLARVSWVVALALSMAIEYAVVRALTRRAPLRRPGLSVIVANAASYAVLIAAFIASWLRSL